MSERRVTNSDSTIERGDYRSDWRPLPTEPRHMDGMTGLAEALVAFITGRRWLSKRGEPRGDELGDVEGGISVHWTPYENWHLIVHADDPPNLIHVLVVGRSFTP